MSDDFTEELSDDFNEDFSEDFVVEDEEGTSNRNFLIAAGGLILLFILIAGAVLISFILQGEEEPNGEIAARETENAIIMATNDAVTRIVQTQQSMAALPEETATEPPAEEPEPTEVEELPPTTTPVPPVDSQATVDAAAAADAVATADSVATSAAALPSEETATPESESSGGDNDTDSESGTGNDTDGESSTGNDNDSESSTGTDSDNSTLPDTGLSAWGFAIIGVGLLFLLFFARRLRTR